MKRHFKVSPKGLLAATEVRTYQNKRNPHKYIERHDDGYGHRSLKQYMEWDRDGGTVTNPTGDGNLHRWRKKDAEELLEDYNEIYEDERPVDEFGNPVEQYPNPEIYGATDYSKIDWSNPPATYIQEGLYWDEDGHEFEVIERTGNKCKVTETWIAEDSGRDVKKTYTYNIESDPVNKTTQEYMYDPKYPEYSRKYAGNAFNYPYGNDPYNPDDAYEYDIEDDPYSEDWEEEDYRSSTRGDYGPSNPWDAPGMSVKDFI